MRVFIRCLLVLSLLQLAACGSGSSSDPAAIESAQPDQNFSDSSHDQPIVTTDSGLQYEVLREATGSKPTRDSYVTVHYIGTLEDGTEFDNSYSRGQPATFLLANTIAGWIEGVQLMSVGSKYRLIIPANLAYADRGAGIIIKPGDTLIFEVELLEINA